MHERTPTVLVAGAGVVGLAAAALLATGRCADRLRVLVLDARPLPRWRADEMDARVYALSRASQQLLEQRRRVAARRASARGAVSAHARLGRRRRVRAERARLRQRRHRRARSRPHRRRHAAAHRARRRARAAPQAQLVVGAEIESVETRARRGRRRARQRRPPARHRAARGRRQRLRRAARCSTCRSTGHRYEQTAVVTHVTSAGSHQDTAWQRFLPGGPLALLPLADGRSSVVWSLPTADAERLLAAGDAEFLAELAAASAGVARRRSRRARRASASRSRRCMRCATPRRASRCSATLRIRCTRSRGKA